MKHLVLVLLMFSISCSKEKTESIEETVDKVEREACEMVNGKLECASKEVKEGLGEVGEKIEDAVDEVSN